MIKDEGFGRQLDVSLIGSCIAAVMRLYGFVKFVEDKCLDGVNGQSLCRAKMISACRGAKDEISEAEIAYCETR